MQENNKHSAFGSWIRERGYYIVLALCVAAVGISGYLYFSGSDTPAGDAVAADAIQTPVTQAEPQEAEPVPVPEAAPVTPTLTRTPPLEGTVVNTFATDHLTYNQTMADWRVHNGIDLAAEAGTPVCAAADGVVSAVWEDDFLGHCVAVSHEGDYTTRYCNLAPEMTVEAGQTVSGGTVLGTVGTSAKLELAEEPHLHFEVTCGGELLNPEIWLYGE